ncbi:MULTISPECIES: hypothetical protein [unclassified Streptomyces]|uniref:hypothetical protein n=1 Tax=unclassified Streptomyces TaxID=2593676 RepID=UPI0035D5BFE1
MSGRPGPDCFAGGTLSICSFRCVQALTRTRCRGEACPAFEKMLTRVGHLGPYAEETSHTAEQLGLFQGVHARESRRRIRPRPRTG